MASFERMVTRRTLRLGLYRCHSLVSAISDMDDAGGDDAAGDDAG